MINQNEFNNDLFEEFKMVNGLNENDKIHDHSDQFKEWILIQQKYLKNYLHFLEEIGIDNNYGLIAELNKCKYNSLVPHLIDKNYDAISITTKKNAFDNQFSLSYIGDLIIYNKLPLVSYQTLEEIKSSPNCHSSFNNAIGTFITQLPRIKPENDSLIIASNYCDTILGAYGSRYDQNSKQKILQCAHYREYLIGHSKASITSELFDGDDNDYYYIIKATCPKKKQLR